MHLVLKKQNTHDLLTSKGHNSNPGNFPDLNSFSPIEKRNFDYC